MAMESQTGTKQQIAQTYLTSMIYLHMFMMKSVIRSVPKWMVIIYCFKQILTKRVDLLANSSDSLLICAQISKSTLGRHV